MCTALPISGRPRFVGRDSRLFVAKGYLGMKEDASKILTLTEDIIRRAVQRGCDAVELFIKRADGITAEAQNGAVEAFDACRDFGFAVRVIIRQKLGFSFTSRIEDLALTLDEAIGYAKLTDDDEYVTIPDGRPPADVKVFDPEIRDEPDEDVLQRALALEELALSRDSRIRKVRKAEVSVRRGNTTILNSRGVHTSYDSGYISAAVTLLAEDEKGNTQTGWDYAVCRRLSDYDAERVASTASDRAIVLLDARKIRSLRAPVILEPQVAVQFLSILSSSLSAEAVQKGRSFLADRVNSRVINPVIDIIDNGVMPWGIGTRPVDDEGFSVSRKALISAGVLNGFIHNAYTAARAKTESTGNAVRNSFKSLPGVSVTNLYIARSGTEELNEAAAPCDNVVSLETLVQRLSRGIVITDAMGIHTANPVSGDFSIGISGTLVEGGKKVHPVKEAVLSGNILRLFDQVEEVADDLRFYGSTGSPSLLIGDMDISA